MENGVPRVVWEKGSRPCDLMDIFQTVFHGNDGFCPPVFWPYDEFTFLIGSSDHDQRSGFDGLLEGKLLDLFMDNLSVLKTYDKRPPVPRL
jgi:hypothetical protein